MACTTILVGKKASFDGSCIIARNDDSPSGHYTPKKTVVITPDKQPLVYESVLSKVKIDLPNNPLSYTATPNASDGVGIWCAAGINSANVAMSATETITTNPRVLAADPLVILHKDENGNEIAGGIGEEDIVHIVLPYIHSAREGVHRLGSLLETYGTYESNGIAFGDEDEIWYLETIGGHHWMAVRVPDDQYVVMPNQLGIDHFDFEDALNAQVNYMCSNDLKTFVDNNNLDLTIKGKFNPREAFGSFSDTDHVYNTPRAWYMLRYFNGNTFTFDGDDAQYKPESDNLPFSLVPEKKITIEDVKYILSSHFQGTDYDPYKSYGDKSNAGKYRCIGINRTDFLGILHIRKKQQVSLEWISYASNVFNLSLPIYTQVNDLPTYLTNGSDNVDSNTYYWASRLVAALADSCYGKSILVVERYQLKVASLVSNIIYKYDPLILNATSDEVKHLLAKKANQEVCDTVKDNMQQMLNDILALASNNMKNSYSRSDN